MISEIIKLELVKTILAEGRIEDAKAKYPSDIDVVDYFVSQDPSGNNKYLPWMMKIYKQDIPGNAPAELKSTGMQHISNLVRGFHQNVARIEVKDINQYKSLDQLHRVVNPLIIKATEKADIKTKEEQGVEKLYEDADWLLMRPLTHEASCKYGANTQWCVAAKHTSTHFSSYSKGFLVFLIHKKSNNKFAFFANTEAYGDRAFEHIEIYNPVDTDITDEGVTIQSFFDGLVNGEMQEFLEYDDNYDEDDEEFELYKVKPDGSRKIIDSNLDWSDLQDALITNILITLLGKGSGRNTLEKHNKVLGYFNLRLVPGAKHKDGTIPWTIYKLRGDGEVSGERFDYGGDLKGYISDGGINDLLEGYMYDDYSIQSLYDIIVKNGLPYVIVGPGFEEPTKPQKESEFSNIMTEEQKNTILKKLIEAEKNTAALNKKRFDDAMAEIINSVSIDRKVLNMVNKCSNVPGASVNGRYTEYFSSCIDRNGYHPYTIPMIWVNPKSGRKLSRSLREIKQKLTTGHDILGRIDMWGFMQNVIPKLLIKQKSDISVEEEPEVKKEPKKTPKKKR